MNFELLNQNSSNICQTSYEYISGNLSTTTEICYNPVIATGFFYIIIGITFLISFIVYKFLK